MSKHAEYKCLLCKELLNHDEKIVGHRLASHLCKHADFFYDTLSKEKKEEYVRLKRTIIGMKKDYKTVSDVQYICLVCKKHGIQGYRGDKPDIFVKEHENPACRCKEQFDTVILPKLNLTVEPDTGLINYP